MIICVCHRVSDRDIARAARDGCASFDALQCALLVATCCGKCHDCARETFEVHVAHVEATASRADPSAAPGRRQVLPNPGQPHHGAAASATA